MPHYDREWVCMACVDAWAANKFFPLQKPKPIHEATPEPEPEPEPKPKHEPADKPTGKATCPKCGSTDIGDGYPIAHPSSSGGDKWESWSSEKCKKCGSQWKARKYYPVEAAPETKPTPEPRRSCPKCGGENVDLKPGGGDHAWFYMNCLDCKHWESSPSDWTEHAKPAPTPEPDKPGDQQFPLVDTGDRLRDRFATILYCITNAIGKSHAVRGAIEGYFSKDAVHGWMKETGELMAEYIGLPQTPEHAPAPPDPLRDELANALQEIVMTIGDYGVVRDSLGAMCGRLSADAWVNRARKLLERARRERAGV
jgi:Zn finger protein HypA/HybF involved in hydrogenase expression